MNEEFEIITTTSYGPYTSDDEQDPLDNYYELFVYYNFVTDTAIDYTIEGSLSYTYNNQTYPGYFVSDVISGDDRFLLFQVEYVNIDDADLFVQVYDEDSQQLIYENTDAILIDIPPVYTDTSGDTAFWIGLSIAIALLTITLGYLLYKWIKTRKSN